MVDRGSSDTYSFPPRLPPPSGAGPAHSWVGGSYLPAGSYPPNYTPTQGYASPYMSQFSGYGPVSSSYLTQVSNGSSHDKVGLNNGGGNGAYGNVNVAHHGYQFHGLNSDIRPLPAHSPLPAHLRSSGGSTGSNSPGSSSPLPAHMRSSPYQPTQNYHLNSAPPYLPPTALPPGYIPPSHGSYPNHPGGHPSNGAATDSTSTKEPILKVPQGNHVPSVTNGNGSGVPNYNMSHPSSYYGAPPVSPSHAPLPSANHGGLYHGNSTHSSAIPPYGHLSNMQPSSLLSHLPPPHAAHHSSDQPVSLATHSSSSSHPLSHLSRDSPSSDQIPTTNAPSSGVASHIPNDLSKKKKKKEKKSVASSSSAKASAKSSEKPLRNGLPEGIAPGSLDLSRLQPVGPLPPQSPATRTILNTPMVSPTHNKVSTSNANTPSKSSSNGISSKASSLPLSIPNVPHPSPNGKGLKNGGWKKRKSSVEPTGSGNAKKLKSDQNSSSLKKRPSFMSDVVNCTQDDPYSFDEEEKRPAPSYGPVYKFKSALLSRESRSGSTDSKSSSSNGFQNKPRLSLKSGEHFFQSVVDLMLEDFQTKTISVSNKPSLDHYRFRLAAKMEKKENRGRKKKSDLVSDTNGSGTPLSSPPLNSNSHVDSTMSGETSLDLSTTPLKTPVSLNGIHHEDHDAERITSPEVETPKKKKSPGRKKKKKSEDDNNDDDTKKTIPLVKDEQRVPPTCGTSDNASSTISSKNESTTTTSSTSSSAPSQSNVKKGSLWALPIVPKLPQKSTDKSTASAILAKPKPVKDESGEVDISDIWRQAFGAGKTNNKKISAGTDTNSNGGTVKIKSETSDEPKKKSCLETPPELRRRPKPNFGGLIHFAPDWQNRVYAHHNKCRIPAQIRERMKVEPKILNSTLPNPGGVLSSKVEVPISENHILAAALTKDNNASSSTATSDESARPRKIVGDDSGRPFSVVDRIIEKRKMRMSIPRLYKMPGQRKSKMKMVFDKLPEESIALMPTPGLPLLTEDTTEILIGSNYGNFRRQTLLRYLDSLDESGELKSKVLDWKPEVLETKTRRQYNQSKAVTNIREIFGSDLPVKAKTKKGRPKKVKNDPMAPPEKVKEEVLDDEPVSSPPSAPDLDSSMSVTSCSETEKTPVKKAKEEVTSPSPTSEKPKKKGPGRMKKADKDLLLKKEKKEPDEEPSPAVDLIKVPETPSKKPSNYTEDDYIPTEKEEQLQDQLQTFALELLDENPSWSSKTVIQNLVIWEPIDPVYPEKKMKKKPKKYKKRQSGLDFSSASKKKAGKSRDTSRANSPEPKESKPIRYSLDNVITESKNWVIDKGAGETILHRASKMGYPDVAAYAVDIVKMNPNLKDNAGIPPIHKAAFKGHHDIVQILLKYGVDPNTNVKGTRPLHEALESGDLWSVFHLLGYGSDPLLYDYSGNMPIDLTGGDEDMKQYLTSILADLHGKIGDRWNVSHEPSFHMPEDLLQRHFHRGPENDVKSGSDDSDSEDDDLIMESSSQPLPAYFQFPDREGRFMFLSDVKSSSKIDLKKQEILEMSWEDFIRTSHCCLLGYSIPSSMKQNEKSVVKLVAVEGSIKRSLGIESSPVKSKSKCN